MKEIKSHGMSSEKASRVKNRGHNKEHIFASLINGEVVKGTKKKDVEDKYGKTYTIKGGSEIKKKEGRDGKWQIFLYSKNRFEKDLEIPARKIQLDLLNEYPKKHKDYEENKEIIQNRIKPHMIKLKEYLSNRENRIEYFDKAFFDKKVDFFVIYDDEIFHIFKKEDVWNVFMENLSVENSKTFRKVVFKYGTLVAEIEVRHTDDGKYPSMLFNMKKRITMNLLLEKIPNSKSITQVIKVYGKAIDEFKL